MLSVHTSPLEQPGSGDSGGMNVYVLALARALAAIGCEVEIFTRSAGADLPRTVSVDDGVRVHHLDAGPPGTRKDDLTSHLCAFYLQLAAHPAVDTLDLLHGHYWMGGWVGRRARSRLGLPLVASFHTLALAKNEALAPGDVPEPPLRLTAEDRVAADADAVLAPTRIEARLLAERARVDASRVHVVEPGVDLAVFRDDLDRQTARGSLGGGRIVLFVGRLQALKAPDDAVRTLAALDEVLGDGEAARLVIVGGPSGAPGSASTPAELRRLASDLGVADRVAILSPRPQHELALLYRAADAVLVPSHSESYGLVALEAQACGTPVVAAATGGLTHAVVDGAGGALVAHRDPRAFAAALAPYLGDPAARDAAGRAGRRHAVTRSWARTADATLGIYRTLVQRPAAAPTADRRMA